MAELLLSQGCVVNACDKKDRRALHWAAHMGYEDVVRLLINHAADVNVKDRHVSAVFFSVILPDLETGCCSSTDFTQMLHFPSDNMYLMLQQGKVGRVIE
jgi:ankyrin repeat protein